MFPLPVWFHYLLGLFVERLMKVPLVSVAQVRMLSEGLSEPWPPCEFPPQALAPRIPFSKEQIRRGLPAAGPFTMHDIRCCYRDEARHFRRVFLEIP